MADDILIEVVYALPQQAISKHYRLPPCATVADAQEAAAADPAFAGIDVRGAPTGVFGKRLLPSKFLREGDRVEIYRALPADPKVARRARARKAGRASHGL